MPGIRARHLVCLILLAGLVTGALAAPYPYPGDNLSISVNRTGNNFIWLWWGNSSFESAPNLTKTIFVDQEKVCDNCSLTYFILTDINPDEEHIIEIRGFNTTLNSWNTTAYATNKSYEQDIWMLLYIGIGLIVAGWFTAPILILLAAPIFLLGFGMAYDMTTQSYIILTYGIGFVFSMVTFALRWNY